MLSVGSDRQFRTGSALARVSAVSGLQTVGPAGLENTTFCFCSFWIQLKDPSSSREEAGEAV